MPQLERRRYFRVIDELVFSCLPACYPQEEVTPSKPNILDALLIEDLQHNVNKIDKELTPKLNVIKDNSEFLGDCLDKIQMKFTFLLRALVKIYTSQQPRHVDISLCGMSFDSINPFSPGDDVYLDMILPSSEQENVQLSAQVVYCQSRDIDTHNKHYKIGLDFNEIDEHTEYLLQRYIISVQTKAMQ